MTDPRSLRILVMGDEGAEHELLASRLAAAGYQVTVARGVAAACSTLRTRDFAAVVADLGVADDGALAVVRAAERGRPPARVLMLLPSEPKGSPAVLAQLSDLAYVCLHHPVSDLEFTALLETACAGYARECRQPVRPVRLLGSSRESARWQRAVTALESALGALAVLWGGEAAPSAETLTDAAENIAGRLQASGAPAFDPEVIEVLARGIQEWATGTPAPRSEDLADGDRAPDAA